ncbi:unnamed protein product, partial [Owenia fusiformis]
FTGKINIRNIESRETVWNNQTFKAEETSKSRVIIDQKLNLEKSVTAKSIGKNEVRNRTIGTEKNFISLKSSKKNEDGEQIRSINSSLKHETYGTEVQLTFRSKNQNIFDNAYQLDITNLRVYVYELDPGFNLDAIDCLNKRPKNYTHGAGCHYDENRGYGRADGEFGRGVKIFKQCQHGIEVIFHNKLLKSPYMTENPDDADLFFVPYYASLICFCQENVKHSDTAIWEVLKASKPYIQKKPHFFAIGVPQRDLFSNPKWTPHCHFLRNRTQLDFVKYAHIESNPLLKDGIDIPRESYIHFISPDVAFPRIKKDILVFMAGKPLGKSLRKILIRQITDKTGNNSWKIGTYFDLTPGKKSCWDSASLKLSKIKCLLKSAQRSIFCLQPPGDTPTRKSFYDMMLTGCIPVIFTYHPTYFYPFQNLIKYNYPFNYDNFTVYIKEERITKQGENIIDILSKIPRDKIMSMQEHLKMIAKYFQYGTYGNGED